MNDRRVTLAQELHDGIAQDLVGLGFSIDLLLSQIEDLKARESLRTIRFTITELIDKVRLEIYQLRNAKDFISDNSMPDFDYELLKVMSEILRNVAEHSEATHLSIQIEDNGKGGLVSKEGSFGLIGIAERIAKINGVIHIDSDQNGTRIGIKLPLDG
jgi:NarL family two-component system sensor histidine kinase LiaS